MLFKVDFDKAFDSISWNYIYSMMNFMGFDSKWIAWIQACLSSSYTSIFVNGSPTSEFKISRGLRQGDPLSLFLFIIGMEGLHAAIEDAISSSYFVASLLDLKVYTFRISSLNTKEKGGLSIRSVQALNSALILKWKWRLLNSSESLWVQIIKGIHGDYGGLLTSPFKSSNHDVWANIIRCIHYLHDKQIIPRNILIRNLGNGRSIKFWEDDWHESGPWKFKYPRLYALESNHSCLVADRYSHGHWTWQWRRNIRDGEEGSQLAALMETLNQLSLDSNPDYWTWEAVLSQRSHLYVPSKVNIFAWRLLLNRLPTRINIMEREIDIPSILCSICEFRNKRCVERIFLHCEVASQIWHRIGIWLDYTFPTFSRDSDILEILDAQQQTRKDKIIMEVIILSTVWVIWRFRNNVIFNNSKFRRSNIFDNIVVSSFDFLSSRYKKSSIDWNIWL
ncbi:RNA-directed DNA polymerase, eukaryota [Tanacetum coccineum]